MRDVEVDATIMADEIVDLIEEEGASLASYILNGDIPEMEARELRNKIRDLMMEEDEKGL